MDDISAAAKYWSEYPLEVMQRGHVLMDEQVREMCTTITALRASLEAVEAEREAARDNSIADCMKAAGAVKRAERAEAALATARRDALEEAAKEIDCRGCYGNPCPRPGECMQDLANEIRALIAQEDAAPMTPVKDRGMHE